MDCKAGDTEGSDANLFDFSILKVWPQTAGGSLFPLGFTKNPDDLESERWKYTRLQLYDERTTGMLGKRRNMELSIFRRQRKRNH